MFIFSVLLRSERQQTDSVGRGREPPGEGVQGPRLAVGRQSHRHVKHFGRMSHRIFKWIRTKCLILDSEEEDAH